MSISTLPEFEAITLDKYETATVYAEKSSSCLRKHVLLKHSLMAIDTYKAFVIECERQKRINILKHELALKSKSKPRVKHFDNHYTIDLVENARNCDYIDDDESSDDGSSDDDFEEIENVNKDNKHNYNEEEEEGFDSDDDDFDSVSNMFTNARIRNVP